MTAPIYKFKGGIRVNMDRPASVQQGIQDQPLAEQLMLPLLEYWGSYSIPVVSPGDRVLKGQLIAQHNHPLGVPRYSPTSGRVTCIKDHHLVHPSGFLGSCITISADGQDHSVPGPENNNYQAMGAQEILQRIYRGGITGMGGGGFPVHAKLNTALQAGVSLLIINALECEPLISCDQALIETCADDIVTGINILTRLLQPSRCVIAIKEDMPHTHELLSKAVSRYADQLVEIVTLPDIYPIGSEKLLIYCLTGTHPDANSIPAARGIVCQNVASVKAVFDTMVLGQPLTSRVITVAGGNIEEPVNLRARLGTPVQALLTNCSEHTGQGRRLVLGGSFNGYPLHHADAPVDAHHNCVLSNPVEIPEVRVQPCIKCGYCTEVCPVELLPQRLLWHAQAKQLDQLVKLNIAECLECGACDTVCPSRLPLTAAFRYARDQIRLGSQQRSRANAVQARFQKHEQRLLAQEASRQQSLQEKSLKQDRKAVGEIIQAALKRTRNANSQGEKK